MRLLLTCCLLAPLPALAEEPDCAGATGQGQASGADGVCPPVLRGEALVAWPPGVPDSAVVELELGVDAEGLVRTTRVVSSEDGRLALAAVRASKALRFEPATREGEAVPSTVRWTVTRASADPGEVVVVESRTPWRERPPAPLLDREVPAGAFRMRGGDLEKTAGAGGDPARALQALPGVQAATVRSTALSIRGAHPSETVWVVEGVPLPAPRSSGTVLSRIPSMLVDELVVHQAAQPASLPGSLGGLLDVSLVDPSDQQVDGVAEVGPGLIQGMVSTPLGRPGSGNAVLVSARRTVFEPVVSVLEELGAADGWALRIEDVALRLRLQPHAAHRIEATGLAGRTRVRSGAEATGLDALQSDDTSTGLAVVRHTVAAGPRVVLEHQASITHEVQDVLQAADDVRRDARTRTGWRGEARVSLGEVHTLVVGAAVTRFEITGEGTSPDPRTSPPFERAPWRRMAPATLDLVPRATWTEGVGFVEHRIEDWRGVDARAGLRVEAWRGQVLASPRVSLGGRVGSTLVTTWAGMLHQAPRDPVLLDATVGLDPVVAARAVQAAITVQQPLGRLAVLRVDGWQRAISGLPVWREPDEEGVIGRSEAVGTGAARGLDAVLGTRGPAGHAAVVGGVQWARRTNPLATPDTVRPAWAVPWSLQVRGGITLGERNPWTLAARALLRAGPEQLGLSAEARGDEVVIVIDRFDREQLGPRWQVGARVQRRSVLFGEVQLDVFADVLVTGGPIVEALVGGVAEDGVLVREPERRAIQDMPVVPWLGARARF